MSSTAQSPAGTQAAAGGSSTTNTNNDIIDSKYITILSNGDITTSGIITSKSGFQLTDANGNPTISFTADGNAAINGNLSAAAANLSGGLSVGGDSSFSGLTTFQKLATFLGKTIFHKDVQVDGHLTLGSDSAGYALIRKGESSVHVTFQTPYEEAPVVRANITNGQFAVYAMDNVSQTGFDLKLQTPASNDTVFSWTALGASNPAISSNPLPIGDQ